MAFVQIIEFNTSDPDGIRAAGDEWRKATEGKRTVRREFMARDRNDSSRYFMLVFFDSYESAMENSNLPETQEIAQKLAKLADGEPKFYDLDIIEERS
jgi:hypothetical protein